MSGVKLQQIDLSAALFVRATLVEADFAGAVMSMTDFSDAMLLNANFTGTDLRGAKFHGANLIGCNFSGARMGPMPISTLEGRRWHTSLEDANLGQAHMAGCQQIGRAHV